MEPPPRTNPKIITKKATVEEVLDVDRPKPPILSSNNNNPKNKKANNNQGKYLSKRNSSFISTTNEMGVEEIPTINVDHDNNTIIRRHRSSFFQNEPSNDFPSPRNSRRVGLGGIGSRLYNNNRRRDNNENVLVIVENPNVVADDNADADDADADDNKQNENVNVVLMDNGNGDGPEKLSVRATEDLFRQAAVANNNNINNNNNNAAATTTGGAILEDVPELLPAGSRRTDHDGDNIALTGSLKEDSDRVTLFEAEAVAIEPEEPLVYAQPMKTDTDILCICRASRFGKIGICIAVFIITAIIGSLAAALLVNSSTDANSTSADDDGDDGSRALPTPPPSSPPSPQDIPSASPTPLSRLDFQLPLMRQVTNSFSDCYATSTSNTNNNDDSSCSGGLTLQDVWYRCVQDGTDQCMGIMWNPCFPNDPSALHGHWKLITAHQPIDNNNNNNPTATCAIDNNEQVDTWKTFVRIYRAPDLYCDTLETYNDSCSDEDNDDDTNTRQSFDEVWKKCDQYGTQVCMGIAWKSCNEEESSSNPSAPGSWKLLTAGQDISQSLCDNNNNNNQNEQGDFTMNGQQWEAFLLNEDDALLALQSTNSPTVQPPTSPTATTSSSLPTMQPSPLRIPKPKPSLPPPPAPPLPSSASPTSTPSTFHPTMAPETPKPPSPPSTPTPTLSKTFPPSKFQSDGEFYLINVQYSLALQASSSSSDGEEENSLKLMNWDNNNNNIVANPQLWSLDDIGRLIHSVSSKALDMDDDEEEELLRLSQPNEELNQQWQLLFFSSSSSSIVEIVHRETDKVLTVSHNNNDNGEVQLLPRNNNNNGNNNDQKWIYVPHKNFITFPNNNNNNRFYIFHPSSGKVLHPQQEVTTTTNIVDGTKVGTIQWNKDDLPFSQQWYFDGTRQSLIHVNSAQVLEVVPKDDNNNDDDESSSSIQLWQPRAADTDLLINNQKWHILSTGEIINLHSAKALTVVVINDNDDDSSTEKIELRTMDGTKSQKWYFFQHDSTTLLDFPDDDDDEFYIIHPFTGKALYYPESGPTTSSSGTKLLTIFQWNTISLDQKWSYNRMTQQIIHVNSGLSLDISGSSTDDDDGTQIQLSSSSSSNENWNQKWEMSFSGEIVNPYTNKTLRVVIDDDDENNNVLLWSRDEQQQQEQQKWICVPVSSINDFPHEHDFYILNPSSGKALHPNNIEDGIEIFQWDTTRTTQMWNYDQLTKRLTNVASQKALDIPMRPINAGASIQLWHSHQGSNQKWESLSSTGEIINPQTGMVLGPPSSGVGIVSNGMDVVLNTRDGSDSQRWIYVPERTFSDFPSNVDFFLVHTPSSKAIHTRSGKTEDGTELVIFHWSTNFQSQRWRYDQVNQRLINVKAGKALEISSGSGSADDGTQTQLGQLSDHWNQKWQLMSTGQIMNPQTGKVLALDGGGTTDGTNVVVQSLITDNDTQKWRCIPVRNFQKFPDNSNIPFYIMNRPSGKVLHPQTGGIEDGTRIKFLSWNINWATQRWRYDNTNKRLINVKSGTSLDISVLGDGDDGDDNNNAYDGSEIQLSEPNQEWNQQWEMSMVLGEIVNLPTNQALSLDDNDDTTAAVDGTNVILQTRKGTDIQKWFCVKQQNFLSFPKYSIAFYIINPVTGKALSPKIMDDDNNADADAGTTTQLEILDWNTNWDLQKWSYDYNTQNLMNNGLSASIGVTTTSSSSSPPSDVLSDGTPIQIQDTTTITQNSNNWKWQWLSTGEIVIANTQKVLTIIIKNNGDNDVLLWTRNGSTLQKWICIPV